MAAVLDIQGLSLSIQGQQILKKISCSVRQGEIVGLIGPNGSGKTTLFNVISGFLAPTEGTVHFHGSDITKVSPSRRAQIGIGRVFQNFGIFREMTLEENILVALEALPREERHKIGSLHEVVSETLLKIGLLEKRKDKAANLSGGQMRLLEIARTFASGKELFLLDEPTAGVSPKMTGQVADVIRELKRNHRTVLIIEHDIPFIASLCDRVFVLDIGEIVLEGTPHEIQQSQKLKEIYFGAETMKG